MKKEHDMSHELSLAGKIKNVVFGSTHGIVSLLSLLTGIATASNSRTTILITGVIALAAGAVTLFSVQYLASKSQKETWQMVVEHEKDEFKRKPKHEIREMRDYYLNAGFTRKETEILIKGITRNEKRWIEAHLTHVLNIFPNKLGKPFRDAVQLTTYHLIGGLLPLVPYFVLPVKTAIGYSIVISLAALFALGAIKNPKKRLQSAVETFLIAAIAVIVCYLLGTAVGLLIA